MTVHGRALIDGDGIVYRAGFSVQGKDRVPTESAAISAASAIIKSILRHLKVRKTTMFLTTNDRSNFRFDLAVTKPYKENRKDAEKPIYYNEIRDYLLQRWSAELISGREADDALGCAQDPDSTVICTQDKDLDMVPGWHYNFVTGQLSYKTDHDDLVLERQERVSKSDKTYYRYVLYGGGIKWFYAQMLLGDRCDNIPGITGLGPVLVDKILADCSIEEDMAATVYNEYQKSIENKPLERFLEIADLLWIQRFSGERKSEHLRRILCQTK